MAYSPIEIDRNALTIMGVLFPDRATLEDAASAIGSNMFEGFVPTQGIAEQQLAATEGFETGVRLFELKRKPIKINYIVSKMDSF